MPYHIGAVSDTRIPQNYGVSVQQRFSSHDTFALFFFVFLFFFSLWCSMVVQHSTKTRYILYGLVGSVFYGCMILCMNLFSWFSLRFGVLISRRPLAYYPDSNNYNLHKEFER